jgi:hypothetical protein
MQDDHEGIDFTEPDDIERNAAVELRRAGAKWGKVLMWDAGIVFALYCAAKLSNWLTGFPASLKDTDHMLTLIFFGTLGICLFDVIASYIGSNFNDFRTRAKQINHRLTKIEDQLKSITEQINR